MEQDLILLNKGVEILIFDLNNNNDDYHILQTQSLIKTWCQGNLKLSSSAKGKSSPGKECQVNIAIRDGKHVKKDIEDRIDSGVDILFVFGGTELTHGHVASDVCEDLIQKRMTGERRAWVRNSDWVFF